MDTSLYLNQARLENKVVLIEGANGTLLDIDFGIIFAYLKDFYLIV